MNTLTRIRMAGRRFASCIVAAAAALVCAPGAWADITSTSVSCDTTDRLLIQNNPVTISSGVTIKVGGNSSGSCNFIAVDAGNGGAVIIDGGKLWCSQANSTSQRYGDLAIGINNQGITGTLTLNSGELQVDRYLRSGVLWGKWNNNDTDILVGQNSHGIININGGTANVGTFFLGADSDSTGSSTLNLSGGTLTVGGMYLRPYNTQTLNWGNGTLAASQNNIFVVETYMSGSCSRTMQITGNPSVFNAAGTVQTIPDGFTGAGTLRIAGGGSVSFAASSVPYNVQVASDGVLNLGTLAANATPLTTPAFSVETGATIAFELPANPSGRYPLVASQSLPEDLSSVTVSCGGATGQLEADDGVLYFAFGAEVAEEPDYLVQSVISDGSQYIDTGVVGKGGTKIEFTGIIYDYAKNNDYVLMGCTMTSGGGLFIPMQGWGAAAEYWGFTLSGGTGSGDARTGAYRGRWSVATAEWATDGAFTLSAGGSTKTWTCNPSIVDVSNTLYLFNSNAGGTLGFNGAKAVCGGLKIWQVPDGGSEYVLVRDFKPCLKNGKAALFDAAHDKIYYSKSGVDLAAGPRVDDAIGLVHRYSFTSDLSDSVGDEDATTIGGTGVTVTDGKATTSTANGALRLGGAGILGTNSVTIEVWGKPDEAANTARAWARAFEYGWGPGQTALFSMMWWSDNSAANYFKDSITFNWSRSTGASGFGNMVGNLSGDSGSPYSTTEMNYISATIDTDANGDTTMTCRRYDAASGEFKTFTRTVAGWSVADMAAAYLDLGQSDWNGTITLFNATYDEVRIYDRAVPGGLLGLNAFVGADTLPFSYDANGRANVTIPANTTVPVNATVFGNTFTTDGTVTLGAGSKLRFDSANCGSGMSFTAEGGFTVPSGGVLDYVELTDTTGYVVALENNGKTVTVTPDVTTVVEAHWTGDAGTGDPTTAGNWNCLNAFGSQVSGGVPGNAASVYIDGATKLSFPANYTPNWASVTFGATGSVSLSAACDWSAIPVVKLADGATLDLNGNNLKATCIEAASGTASVVNTAGTKPLLWRENATHETALVGTGVTVDTANVEVKLVNSENLTIEANIASSLDATFEQSAGDVTATANPFGIGTGGHTGYYTLNGGTFTSNGSLVPGWGGTGTFRQVAGTVNAKTYLTIGYKGGTGTYLMEDGTLAVRYLYLGQENSGNGTFRQSGGSVTIRDHLYIGNSGGTGTYWQTGGSVTHNGHCFVGNEGGTGGRYIMEGGSLTVANQALRIGRNSPGEFSISNGTVEVTYQTWVGDGATGNGTLRVKTGGTLITPFITPNEDGENTVEFDGGTVKATDLTATNPFLNSLTNIVFGTGGVTIDADGHDLTITNCTFNAAPSAKAITFANGGTLTFTNTTLKLTGAVSGSKYVFAEATGNGVFSGKLTLDKPENQALAGWSVRLSSDRKKVLVLKPGVMLVVE